LNTVVGFVRLAGAMSKIQRALISVRTKRVWWSSPGNYIGSGSNHFHWRTARALKEASVPVVEISEFTGFPEMLDGRVKNATPESPWCLLYVRGNAEPRETGCCTRDQADRFGRGEPLSV